MVQSYNFMFMVPSYNFLLITQFWFWYFGSGILVLVFLSLKKKQWCKAIRSLITLSSQSNLTASQ